MMMKKAANLTINNSKEFSRQWNGCFCGGYIRKDFRQKFKPTLLKVQNLRKGILLKIIFLLILF